MEHLIGSFIDHSDKSAHCIVYKCCIRPTRAKTMRIAETLRLFNFLMSEVVKLFDLAIRKSQCAPEMLNVIGNFPVCASR